MKKKTQFILRKRKRDRIIVERERRKIHKIRTSTLILEFLFY